MLDLAGDAAALTAALVDVESVSGNEAQLADQVEAALRECHGLAVQRDGNVVIARTDLGLDSRVALAGHLDTVPVAGNVPARREADTLFGCGASDMKSGLAVLLRIAHLVGCGALEPRVDLSWIAYDCEEVEAARNGLGRLARQRPDLLTADLAILLEPTSGQIEGGCQGTMRAVVRTEGVRAHSARSWLGSNAIHAAAEVLRRLVDYPARVVDVDGLQFREGLNAVAITGGVAGNIVPDSCAVTVNYRFAPDRTVDQAEDHLREVFTGYPVDVIDAAPAARPGLTAALAAQFAAHITAPPGAKLGWTDVARFAELGIPALNYGPGDPDLAHKPEESVDLRLVAQAERVLTEFLTRAPAADHERHAVASKETS